MVAVNRSAYSLNQNLFRPLSEKSFSITSISSVPNFRLLCGSNLDEDISPLSREGSAASCRRWSVFRSSRPDFISNSDLDVLKDIGIKSIIDCRSEQEYQSGNGSRLLDQEYQLYTVKLPNRRNYQHDEAVQVEPVGTVPQSSDVDGVPHRRHYLINFFTRHYVFQVFWRAPWYTKCLALFFLLYDYLFKTGYRHFVRLFAKRILNTVGLLGQYKDIVNYSQSSLCAALKLISKEENLPTLVNCAHGKDRTGIVSALVLHCQGKSPDYIAAEYALSETGLKPIKRRLRKEMVERYHLSEDFLRANADTMQQLFGYIIQSYGSVNNYLEFIGFGPPEQEALRSALQVKPSDAALLSSK